MRGNGQIRKLYKRIVNNPILHKTPGGTILDKPRAEKSAASISNEALDLNEKTVYGTIRTVIEVGG